MRKSPAGVVAPRPATPTPGGVPTAGSEHLRNPTLAQALFNVWSGDAAVVVDSPPGAGKTHLITYLAHQLHTRAGMTVGIAAQTRAQGVDVANRTAALGARTLIYSDAERTRARDLTPAVGVTNTKSIRPGHGVVVATTARWLWTPRERAVRFDVLLIDEAYQLTYGDLGALGVFADQFVLVGDPGQIAPVVTGETRRWATLPTGPQVPAPLGLLGAHPDDVSVLRIPQTWRLGPDTTALLAPLYPTLPFTSARMPRTLTVAGSLLPEYRAMSLPVHGGVSDRGVIAAAEHAARAMIADGALTSPDGTRPVEPGDVAVIAPHVEQAALIAASLSDLPDVFVGTINQAQGLQREAVVAVHPMLGHDSTERFALDLGRLCVALSRHHTHLTVVTDTRTPGDLATLARERTDSPLAAAHGGILDRLLAS